MKKKTLLTGLMALALSGLMHPAYAGFKVMTATDGATSDEDASNLFTDGSYTKWCVKFSGNAYVTFQADDEMTVDGYTITTGYDCNKYPGRNPKDWVMEASTDYNTWDTLSVVKDATMENTGGITYTYRLPEGTTKKYKYFNWTITAVSGSDVMQANALNILPACTHSSFTHYDAETADCTHSTHAEYWKCDNCGRLFSDTTSKKVITDFDSYITEKAWGHKYVKGICSVCGEWSTPYLNEIRNNVDDLLITSKSDTISGKCYPWVAITPKAFYEDLTPGIMPSNSGTTSTVSQTEITFDSPTAFKLSFNWQVDATLTGLTVNIDGETKVSAAQYNNGYEREDLAAGKHTLVATFRRDENGSGYNCAYLYNIRLDTTAESAITTKQDEHAKFSVSAETAKTGDEVKLTIDEMDRGYRLHKYTSTPCVVWKDESTFYMPGEPVTIGIVLDTIYYITVARADSVKMTLSKTEALAGYEISIKNCSSASDDYKLYKLTTSPNVDMEYFSQYDMYEFYMPKQDVTIIPLFYRTIIFADYDGTILKNSKVGEGEMPEAPADPTREPKDGYAYVFKGWTSEIEAVTNDKIYIATYDAIATTEVTEQEAESKKTVKRIVDGRVEIVTPEGSVFGANGGRIK